MNARRVLASLAVVILVASILISVGVFASDGRQPEPAHPGVPAPALEAAYRVAQADPSATEEARIRAAVDTYFILKFESRVRGNALELGSVIDLASVSGKRLHDYELGRLQFCLRSWQLCGLAFGAYNYRPVYDSIEVHGRSATVVVHPWVDLTYADVPDQPDVCGGEPHRIALAHLADGWKIVSEDYEDEFALAYPRSSDFALLEDRLPEELEALKQRWTELDRTYREDPRSRHRYDSGSPVEILGYRTYGRSSAASYGLTYTDNSGGGSTTYYNKLFVAYASDCQNFVSQCIWFGFGGQNNSTAINNHYLPMVYSISGATSWWADKTTSEAHWYNVGKFKEMVEANWNSDKVGVQAHEGALADVWHGDFVVHADLSHVYIVVRINDLDGDGVTDYNEIYVSSHTNNRKDYRLASLISIAAVRFMYVERFKNP